MRLFFIFIFLVSFSHLNAYCPTKCITHSKPGYLNVHILPSTHLDLGWTSTFQEYYDRFVKQIFNSVTENLQQNSQRKFQVAETAYFMKWYNEQSYHIQQVVRQLVNSAQLEFVNGAFSMNDEAAAYYKDIIDNFAVGHQSLNTTFGECAIPRIGWQIDPFGHSREHASLLSQMQFNGLFLGRVDFQDKIEREKSKSLEFVWKTSPSLGERSDLFTSILPNVYWPPTNFCFDINCYDDPITDFNLKYKTKELIDLVKIQATIYATSNTILTMGMDFYYRDAKKWFVNLEALMDEINSQRTEKVHMFYSSPECYLESVQKEASPSSMLSSTYKYNSSKKHRWPVKIDDFFPYADAMNAYWTGYFTSRPSLKLHIKHASNLLTASKQLSVLSKIDRKLALAQLRPLKEAVALMQHHDAITGTCKQYVADDYHDILSKGMYAAQQLLSDSLALLMKKSSYPSSSYTMIKNSPPRMEICSTLNVSKCAISEDFFMNDQNTELIVNVYNPIAHELKHYLRIPVGESSTGVFVIKDNSNNEYLNSQVSPVNGYLSSNRNYVPNELVFKAVLPPLGYSVFSIKHLSTVSNPKFKHSSISLPGQSNTYQTALPNFSIGNSQLKLEFDGTTGLILNVQTLDPSTNAVTNKIDLTQNFYIYRSKERGYSSSKPSGAYRFSPIDNEVKIAANKTTYKVFRGSEADEVHQVFTHWITQVVRIYKGLNSVEFSWQIGPIPINGFYDNGYEIVTRFDTNLQTNNTFFTDSNGRETLRRIINHRPTFNLVTTEKYSSNYYPVTSWAFMHDHQMNQQVTLLPDRSVGCTSPKSGSLELMLHRRLLFDDGYGMDEPLNEVGADGQGLIIRGKTHLIIGNIQESVKHMRILSKIMNNKPIMTFKPVNSESHYNEVFLGLKRKLPPNIHLLSLEPYDENYVLVRLEHFFEINEDQQYSKSRKINLEDLFVGYDLLDYKETTLNVVSDRMSAENTRLKFDASFNPYANFANIFISSEDNEPLPPNTVLLKPMEIRTFLVRLRPIGL